MKGIKHRLLLRLQLPFVRPCRDAVAILQFFQKEALGKDEEVVKRKILPLVPYRWWVTLARIGLLVELTDGYFACG